jgi:hypothetical protein
MRFCTTMIGGPYFGEGEGRRGAGREHHLAREEADATAEML